MTDVPSSSPWIVWPLPDDVRDLIAALVPDVTSELWYSDELPAYLLRLCGELYGRPLSLSNMFQIGPHARGPRGGLFLSQDRLRAAAVQSCQNWNDYLKRTEKGLPYGQH